MSGKPGGRYSGGPHPGEKAIPSPGVVHVRVIGADAAAARLAAVFGDNWHRHSLSPAGHGESGRDALVGLLTVRPGPEGGT